MGRLANRYREQAHSYHWNEYIRKKQLGCQAAFASKLAHRRATAERMLLLLLTTQQDER
jgi:hypothetical protein